MPQRAARLSEVRVADPEMADAVSALLDRQSAVDAEGFLEGSALPMATELAGRKVGHYTLERAIGHGGMGAVWLARRSDGRFDSTVAVKFLNLALLGRAGAERFEREGRLLARLQHPNIARLLDAGVDAEQPYLVLEYVDGDAIDRWCDARQASVNDRIRLFLDVLAAVAHAHSQLVLHRDLKPANILVTSTGVVKLLDFGIAKLLEAPDEAPRMELTEFSGPAFTPAYAAPEQVQAGGVTMATDVYALGVLFCELMTGIHPTAAGARTPVDRLRALIDVDAARLSDTASGVDAAAALHRSTTPRKLARALRGDLDNIAARALKKAAAERYQTVSAFADDLQRFLNHEPVTARADSFAYRAGRFVRRNRFAVGAAAALVLTLAAGALGTVWQAREAARQRDLALRQLERAETASAFVTQMLGSTWGADDRISRGEFLERSEALALRELSQQPEQQSVVLQALSAFYSSLGDYAHAEPLSRRALELLPSSADLSWRASIECNSALDRWLSNKAETSVATLSRWAAEPAIDPATAALCAGNLAKIAWNSNDAAGALRHALSEQRLLLAAARPRPAALAGMHSDLAYAYSINGRGTDADREFAAALAIYASLGKQGSPNAIAILNNWSTAAINAGDVPRALSLFDEVIRLARTNSAGNAPPPYALGNRAAALLALGRYDEAIAQAGEARQVSQRANNKVFEVSAMLSLAGAHMERGEFDAAEQFLEEAAAAARDIPADSSIALIAKMRRARLALLRGDATNAAAVIAPVIALFEARGMRISTLCLALRIRGESERRLGDRPAAIRDAEAALAIARTLQGERPHSLLTGLSWLLVAQVRRDSGDAAGTRAAAQSAIDNLLPMLGAQHPDTQLASTLASS